MFFRLSKILLAFVILFLLVTAGSRSSRNYEFRNQDEPGKAMVTVDSTLIDSESTNLRKTLPIGRFSESQEKDNPSSLNSVNLIIYMIYKVTDKSIN